MPELARFYGIIIKMFYSGTEHNRPHIHAMYAEYMGSIDIRTRKLIVGDLPNKAMQLIVEWISLHEEELLEIWETQVFKKIPPLD